MRDLRLLPYIVAALLMVMLAVGAAYTAPTEHRLDITDDGSALDISVGQVLVITLDSNPTTGYSWQVTEYNEQLLAQVGEAQYRSGSNLVGAGGQETLRFRAIRAGQTTLTLAYQRPWEKGVAPEKSFAVNVTVH